MTKITTNERYQQDEVLSAVFAADSVLLFSHIFPDGDTLGSALAMKLRLERLGKRVQLMLDGVVPSYLAFLPGAVVSHLIRSCLEYTITIAVVYIAMGYLGVDIRALSATVGFLSLINCTKYSP